MDIKHQQTVEVAVDTTTGELLEATKLSVLPDEAFNSLRRIAMSDRLQRRRGNSAARFICLLCRGPLYISRHNRANGNRWFMHDGGPTDCRWREKGKLTADQLKAVIYRGQQEGEAHKSMKNFIAQWLEKEPNASQVDREAVTYGEVLKGEWKRPDVKCLIGSKQIVFEIQLAYTFLSEVIKRDVFYGQEHIFIIWVFRELDLRRSTVADEFFHNNRNVFVLDAKAMAATKRNGRLTFSGHFHRPCIESGEVKDVCDHKLLTLDEIQFPTATYRPFFFDYAAEKLALLNRIAEETAATRLREWREQLSAYLRAVIAYAESDYQEGLKPPILTVAGSLYESPYWHRGLEVMSDSSFFGWHGVLTIILSIKLNRPVGFNVDTAYRVLEAGVRKTKEKRRAFAILYLWAYKTYKPSMTPQQKVWAKNLAAEIKRSVDSGDDTFARFTAYDGALGMLFPELEGHLLSDFGRIESAV